MSDEKLMRDGPVPNPPPTPGGIERRHTVSIWFYLIGAVAFLLGCYLLFLEDSIQTRTTLPTLSPRTQLFDGEPAMVKQADARTTAIYTTAATTVPPTPDVLPSLDARPFSKEFLDSVWRDAAAAGVQRGTFERAFANVRSIDTEVLRLSLNQPEFDRTVGDYVSTIVNVDRIAVGRARLEQQAVILDAIERQYGVPRTILLAVWGIESNFGLAKGDRSVIRSLATLAWTDARRAVFWRDELKAALTILELDRIAPEQLAGSWAGAMGHTQFMPSTYVKYAVDYDGDGVRDVWGSVPDALASTARYLQASGWIAGKPWGREVVLPAKFDYALTAPGQVRSMAAWRVLGVRAQTGVLPSDDGTLWQVLVPAGANGPAFLVSPNFDALLAYNRAYSYAIAVGVLADRIAGNSGLQAAWPADDVSLSREQRTEMQGLLVSLGYDAGVADGILGTKTREAIRGYQKAKSLPMDGFPNMALLERLRSERRP